MLKLSVLTRLAKAADSEFAFLLPFGRQRCVAFLEDDTKLAHTGYQRRATPSRCWRPTARVVGVLDEMTCRKAICPIAGVEFEYGILDKESGNTWRYGASQATAPTGGAGHAASPVVPPTAASNT